MTSPAAVLLGAQRPRILSAPESASSAGGEAADLAAHAGLILDDWQRFSLDVALGERRDGQWSAFEVGLVVPRQDGKGAILEARELAGLFLFGERLILHSAHEFKTAQEAFRRILFLVENTPDLWKRVLRVRTSHGEEGIELRSGARLRFVARSTGSGRGFSGDTVILDEAYALTSEAMAALLPTMAARPNPQLWYTSSAGMTASTHLKSVRARGIAGVDAHLAYLEWSAPEEAIRSLDDRRWWAMANPALGIRMSEEFIAKEFAAMSSDLRQFARERLGIWSDEVADTVVAPDVWQQAQEMTAHPGQPLVLGVEVHGDNDAGAIVAADGKALEVVEHQVGADWLASRTFELCARHRPTAVALDASGPARSLLPDLEGRGFRVVKLGSTDMGAACTAWLADLAEGLMAVRPHAGLTAAVAKATKKPTGDTWVWRRGDEDMSTLIAATAAWWQSKQPPPRPGIASLAD